jgi:hypothetical protein
MGFTHYFTQTKTITKEDWVFFTAGVRRAIPLSGVKVAYELDQPETAPAIDDNKVRFNGVGGEGCETFIVHRLRPALDPWREKAGLKRGWDFCKTRREPYDVLVTACLVYLESIEGWPVGSDGAPKDWVAGLKLAKAAWPELSEKLHIPDEVMRDAA